MKELIRKHIWLLATWAVYVALSFGRMPLTYDETWNYNETAAHGPLYVVTPNPAKQLSIPR